MEAPYDEDRFIETFSELSGVFNFSLRVQEQCFSQFLIALRTTPANYKLCPTLLAGLICIRAAFPTLYKEFTSGNTDANSIVKSIARIESGQKFLDSDEGMIFEALLLSSKCSRGDLQTLITPYEKSMQNESMSESEKTKAERMLELFNYVRQQGHYGLFEYLSKKIEITDQFAAS